MSHDEFVSDYIGRWRPASARRRWKRSAVRRIARKRSVGQRGASCLTGNVIRISTDPEAVIGTRRGALAGSVKKLAEVNDFHALHEIVRGEIGSVNGIKNAVKIH